MLDRCHVVAEHKDWLLCYKPAGLNFHSEDGEAGFVVQMSKLVDCTLLPVHRLDKPTSGLILLAKHQQSCARLCELFANRQVDKYYLALCPSAMKKKQGAVVGDMTKSRRGAFKLLSSKINPAITQFFSVSLGKGVRLCLLKPKTGKTHQLRVMLKSLGSPILGDQQYSGLPADRLYLHSYAIKFTYDGTDFSFVQKPFEGELFTGTDFIQLIELWQSPWQLQWPKL